MTWELFIGPSLATLISVGVAAWVRRSAGERAETMAVALVEARVSQLRRDLNGHLAEVAPMKNLLHDTNAITLANREIIVRIEKTLERMISEQSRTNERLDRLIEKERA